MPLAVDFQGGLSNAWSNVAALVPKLAAALLIILRQQAQPSTQASTAADDQAAYAGTTEQLRAQRPDGADRNRS